MTPTPDPLRDEDVARLFHDAYERLAPSFGYETRKASAVPWSDVPETNRLLMVAVASEVRAALAQPAPALDADLDSYLTLHFRHAHGCGETREFPWDCDCGYRDHLHAIEAALAQPAPALDGADE